MNKVVTESLNGQVYEYLKNKIMSGELSPGQRINVKAIEDAIGISATPIKASLIRLAEDGLVDHQPRKGAVVSKLTNEEFRELCVLRTTFEQKAAELILSAEDVSSRIKRLQEIVNECHDYLYGDTVDFLSFMDSDMEFHEALVSASGCRKLYEYYSRLHIHIQMAKTKYDIGKRAYESHDDHVAIVSALATGDSGKALAVIEDHVSEARDFFLEQIELE